MVEVTAVRFVRGATTIAVYPYADAADNGVWLGKDQVEGIYDAPIKSTWKTGAFQDGSRQKAHKKLHRDMQLGFMIRDTASSYELNESTFRQLFDYEIDPWDPDQTPTTMEIETTLSGTRKLDVLMYEEPSFTAGLDPIKQQFGNLILKLRAGQPMWYEDDAMDFYEYSGSSATWTITVENPTDQVMRHEWVLTPATWVIPDVSWTGIRGERTVGGSFSNRTITVSVTTGDGIARISLDRQKLMIRNSADTNILARLGGQAFAFPIPPYTPATELPISYSGAPGGGARAELWQPRRWSRPWGLELNGGS